MIPSATPMLHVPDVQAAVDWYAALGFEIIDVGQEDGAAVWAHLAFGHSRLMFNCGGQPSQADRREVDLYLRVDDVDDRHDRLANHVEVIEPPHDTFYGMREFIIRDLNRFWITFGQAIDLAPEPPSSTASDT